MCLFSVAATAADTFTLVIDAGHGGKDPGAVNGKKQEKTINLDVALKAGKLIESKCKDVKVIYTRKTDVFVELSERAAIANRASADLFISIHTNSTKSTSAYGAETFLLGVEEKRTSANLNVALKENEAILYENDYETKYAGYDPGSAESMIIFEFMQNEHQKESLRMAELVQDQLTGHAKRHDRGVHQAGFLVLWKNAMPSILVELGFISNTNDMKYMTSDAGASELAESIYLAFSKYLDETRNQSRPTFSESQTQKEESDSKASEATGSQVGTVYKVQFLSSGTQIKLSDKKFDGLDDVECRKEGNLWKYTSGSTQSYEEARKILAQVRKKYKDAFIVTFQDGARAE